MMLCTIKDRNLQESQQRRLPVSSRHAELRGNTHRMRWQDSICVVPPPHTQTVKKTKSRVVENII